MRLRKIDFLRGIAILLVMSLHHPVITRPVAGGWMGVDLFFVLSGFLVSGLLFNEYKRRDSVNIGRFFIRRGFKIYPLFYVTLIAVILLKFLNENHWPQLSQILTEVFFLQSYFKGLLNVTWSLAVEEHFYILIMICMAWLSSTRQVTNRKIVYGFGVFIAAMCLGLRILNNVNHPYDEQTHLFPTHLRIDSLLAGVMIAYTWNFHREQFMDIFRKNKTMLWIVCFLLITMPFYMSVRSFFMNTLGLTLVYVGYAILLSLFLVSDGMDQVLDKILSKHVVDGIAKIGFYSYGIYLWHAVSVVFVLPIVISVGHIPEITPLRFLIYAILGIGSGIFMSMIVEQPFLKLRERMFPHESLRAANANPVNSIRHE